jgi:hypothetical protein
LPLIQRSNRSEQACCHVIQALILGKSSSNLSKTKDETLLDKSGLTGKVLNTGLHCRVSRVNFLGIGWKKFRLRIEQLLDNSQRQIRLKVSGYCRRMLGFLVAIWYNARCLWQLPYPHFPWAFSMDYQYPDPYSIKTIHLTDFDYYTC